MRSGLIVKTGSLNLSAEPDGKERCAQAGVGCHLSATHENITSRQLNEPQIIFSVAPILFAT